MVARTRVDNPIHRHALPVFGTRERRADVHSVSAHSNSSCCRRTLQGELLRLRRPSRGRRRRSSGR
eukprot:3704277-Heterocapsa_arctica.AAC.1